MGILDYFKPKQAATEAVAMTQGAQYYPQSFNEYIGQFDAIQRLRIAIRASLIEGRKLGDVLLYGYSGTGKTALAQIIALELGVPIKTVIGGAIETSEDLARLVSYYDGVTEPPTFIVFIDEIHAMPKKIQELLYSAFDSGEIDVTTETGTVRLKLPPITLIGATTEIGRLTKPLINRFQNVLTLQDYSVEDMGRIVAQTVQKLARNITVTPEAIGQIAARARFTPRTANNLLSNVLDYTLSEDKQVCEAEDVEAMSKIMGIYPTGATKKDINLLKIMHELFEGRPVGLKTLSGAALEDEKTVEQIYEPFLLRKGYIIKTARGRQVTEVGLRVLTSLTKYDKVETS